MPKLNIIKNEIIVVKKWQQLYVHPIYIRSNYNMTLFIECITIVCNLQGYCNKFFTSKNSLTIFQEKEKENKKYTCLFLDSTIGSLHH